MRIAICDDDREAMIIIKEIIQEHFEIKVMGPNSWDLSTLKEGLKTFLLGIALNHHC